MFALVALIILIASLAGMGVIIYRKMPAFLELPQAVPVRIDWKSRLVKVKDSSPFKNFSFEIFLQKILSKIRILTLKTDSKTSSWLQELRAKANKKKFEENGDYWRKVRSSTKK
jgi:hypothetical protein